MHRAYSIIDVKGIDESKRAFSGTATTPSLDRVNDSINSLGAKFAKEIPLLHAHDSSRPIGFVRLGKATKAGIPFDAEIPVIHEPPTLKERVDVAFGEILHGLVKAVSIGFRPLSMPKRNEQGGYDFEDVEIMELSTVAIPAHQDALIHTVKSLDRELRKAAGVPEPDLVPKQFKSADGVIYTFTDEDIVEIGKSEPAATGKKVHVAKLNDPARDRAKPFVIKTIHRLE